MPVWRPWKRGSLFAVLAAGSNLGLPSDCWDLDPWPVFLLVDTAWISTQLSLRLDASDACYVMPKASIEKTLA
jgi:hypothetical protein